MAAQRTEARHPAAEGLQDQTPTEIIARLHAAQIGAVEAVQPAFASLAAAAEAGATALQRGRRLVYVGAGSSGLMALSDCLELSGTFGIPPDRTPMLFAGGARALLHMTGAVEDDPAGSGAQKPGQSAQQCGLAAGIGADDHRDASVRDREGQIGDDRGVAVPQRQEFGAQSAVSHGSSLSCLRGEEVDEITAAQ